MSAKNVTLIAIEMCYLYYDTSVKAPYGLFFHLILFNQIKRTLFTCAWIISSWN